MVTIKLAVSSEWKILNGQNDLVWQMFLLLLISISLELVLFLLSKSMVWKLNILHFKTLKLCQIDVVFVTDLHRLDSPLTVMPTS